MITIRDLFDEEFYLKNNPEVAEAVAQKTFASGFEHFLQYGQREGRDPGPMFNTEFYISAPSGFAEVFQQKTFLTPSEHFVWYGQTEGRNPSAYFNTQFYLTDNPGVATASNGGFLTPIQHFIQYGQYEGRLPKLLFSNVYVFGDSLSDDGNGFALTQGQLPPSPPYNEGRFTNGLAWIETMTPFLRLPVNPDGNLAFGGATSGTLNVNTDKLPAGSPPLPGLADQIDGFIQAIPQADPDALYVVWAGANDYMGGNSTDVAQTIDNLATAITDLAEVGAKNFLIPNLPDLSKTPLGRSLPVEQQQGLGLLTQAHNNALLAMSDTLEQNPNINIIPVDVYTMVNNVIAAPGEFNLTNVTDNFLTSGATDASQYLFWDILHPTAVGHDTIAQGAITSITRIPEVVDILQTSPGF